MALRKINHTQLSNEFIDEHMRLSSDSAAKVFVAISRKTVGWHKETDYVSISQIQELTGLSNRVVVKAVRELESKDLIEVKRLKGRTSAYSLKYSDSDSVTTAGTCDESSLVNSLPVTKSHRTCDESSQVSAGTCDESSHTKESIKENRKKLHQWIVNRFYTDYQQLYNEKIDLSKKEIGAIQSIVKKAEKQSGSLTDQKELVSRKIVLLHRIASARSVYQNWMYLPSVLLYRWNELVPGCCIADREQSEKDKVTFDYE